MSNLPSNVNIFGFTATNPVPIAADAAGRLITSPPTTAAGVQATIFANNGGSMLLTTEGLVTATIQYGENNAGTGFDPFGQSGSNSDGQIAFLSGNQLVNAYQYGFNGDVSNNAAWDRVRVANVFKTATTAAAGSTAVWTPAAGKKFRLMGYSISAAGTMAATGFNVINLLDSATAIAHHVAPMIQTTTVSISGESTQISVNLGNGILSAVAANVLNLNLGTALTAGAVTCNAWGTEE